MKKNIKYYLIIAIFLIVSPLKAIFPINFFYPDDHPFKLQRIDDHCWQFSTYLESSFKVNGRDSCGRESNILQIWSETQDALAMVRGFPLDSKIGQFSLPFNSIADDGSRGHLKFFAQSTVGGIFPIFRLYLPKDLTISLTTPFYWMQVKNFCMIDQTKQETFGDFLVKEEITDKLNRLLFDLGDGLTIGDWQRFGPGDFWLEVDWIRNFYQPRREHLTNVLLNIRGGLTLPTGLTQDVDQVLSIPFGNDRALGVVFGAEVQLNYWNKLIIGIDAEFWQLFGATKYYRVKTDPAQTDFLLLAKTKARKRWGLTQRYDLWAEFKICYGFSVEACYQHFKHNRDKYSFFDPSYIESIANTAGSLQEWTAHNAIFILKCNRSEVSIDSAAVPQLAFFIRKPFNGHNIIQATTFGFSLVLDF